MLCKLHESYNLYSIWEYGRSVCRTFSQRNENIPFTANKNPKVQILYEINELAGIRDNDLDFSTSLFAKSLERRYNWLEGRVDKFLQKDNIPSEKRSRLEFLLSELKGHK